MRKLCWVAALLFAGKLHAQTLFTYGSDSVSVKEFLQAYTKNNANNKTGTALQEYLDLYIASRLKIKEAEARGYDTLPQLVSDMDNLRNQILPMYERDAETLNRLAAEAFDRSQKDMHLAHIFISFTDANGKTDPAAAKKKAEEAYERLLKNNSFSDVALNYSDDPSVKKNKGDIGFITAFTLPYELENLAYKTAPGKISPLYQSTAGYHIFKNMGERKALGRIKAAQILIAFPPEATDVQKKAAKKLADSLYNRITKGDDFEKLATEFSNDYISAAANGAIPVFGVGEFEPVFENLVFSLKNGAVSAPFETEHGYHIVKKISQMPIPAKKDATVLQEIKEKVEQSDRIQLSKEVQIQKVLKEAPFQRLAFSEDQLWAYSDSLFSSQKPAMPLQLNGNTSLFAMGQDTTRVADWILFSQVARYKTDGSGFYPYPQVWEEFIHSKALNYYKNNLEAFNPDFKNQMQEFKEGNLFFEIMQREIWGPAQNDSIALKNYFEKNKAKYTWTKSTDAVIFYTGDVNTAQQLAAQLRKTPNDWKDLVTAMNDKVTADSGRFELNQVPGQGKNFKEGEVTQPLLNALDNTASFAYIVHLYPQPAQRTYEEAKGLVINDYQAALEKNWVDELKKKYPVRVNQTVWNSLQHTAKK